MRLYIIRHAEPAYPDDALTARGHRQARAIAKRFSGGSSGGSGARPRLQLAARARPGDRPLHGEAPRPRGRGRAVDPRARGLVDPRRGRSASAPPGRSTPPPCAPWGRGSTPRAGRTSPPSTRPPCATASPACAPPATNSWPARGTCARGSLPGHRPAGRRVALFCHGGFALTWLADLLAIPLPLLWAGFTLLPAAVTTVVFEPGPEGWAAPRCLALGETDGLGGG